MMDEFKNEIINTAKWLVVKLNAAYEDPITVVNLESNHLYDVVFPYPGASDPNIGMDPPSFTIRVDMETLTAELVPEM